MSDQPIVRSSDSVAADEVARARKTSVQVLLGAADGVPSFYTRQFTIQPGGRIPEHRHDCIEHEQLVLEGEMALWLDGEQVTARAGDCVYIPARVAHAYENRGSTPVRFICVIPAKDYETEWLEQLDSP